MFKSVCALAACSAFVALPASAAPQKMTADLLDQVVAGTYVCPPPVMTKGNNGWGNGADGPNPGTYKGATRLSKIGLPAGSGRNVPGATGINKNPTMSSGR